MTASKYANGRYRGDIYTHVSIIKSAVLYQTHQACDARIYEEMKEFKESLGDEYLITYQDVSQAALDRIDQAVKALNTGRKVDLEGLLE